MIKQEIKRKLRELSEKIRTLKCERACALRIAQFNSYDHRGFQMNRWGKSPWNNRYFLTKRQRTLWLEHDHVCNELINTQGEFKIEHTAYCLLNGSTLDEMFKNPKNLQEINFIWKVEKKVQKWKKEMENEHVE